MRLFRLIPDMGDDGKVLAVGVAQKRYGFVEYNDAYEISVLAETEKQARVLASKVECYGGPMWLDVEAVSCVEVDTTRQGIVTCASGTG